LRQQAGAQLDAILARPGCIAKSRYPMLGKASAPAPDRIGLQAKLAGNLIVAFAAQARQNDACALDQTSLSRCDCETGAQALP